MYLAELHGKFSPKIERKEDVLTSNVFSFFKYCNRTLFLKKYLEMLGFQISDDDVNNAKFIFWPRYEENTEPDLVIRVGGYYILFEAKYFSDFDDETSTNKAQLIRELEGGKLEAKSYNESFFLVAITADYCEKPERFQSIPSKFIALLKWTNWQKVTTLIQHVLESDKPLTNEEREFAGDLYRLLCKKGLREYIGIETFSNLRYKPTRFDSIFFKAETASYRGAFIGFCSCFTTEAKLKTPPYSIFFSTKFFDPLAKISAIISIKSPMFFKGNRDG